jgi:hypothetical protein
MHSVVFGAPGAGREDAPRLVDLTHVRRGLLVRMQVGMEALGEAPVSACDLLLGGISSDPEDGVGVVERLVWHCCGF